MDQDDVVTGDAGRPPLQRRLSLWLVAAFVLAVVVLAGSLSWFANGGIRDAGSEKLLSLRHADLTGADMLGAVLRDVSLEGATLKSVDLSHADLRSADFSWTAGVDVDLSHTCLTNTIWLGSTLRSINLDGADLRGADFRRATVEIASAHDAIADNSTRWGPNSVPPVLLQMPPTDAPCS